MMYKKPNETSSFSSKKTEGREDDKTVLPDAPPSSSYPETTTTTTTTTTTPTTRTSSSSPPLPSSSSTPTTTAPQQVNAFGNLTQVPSNVFCQLSYYLKCVTLGCGIHFVFDKTLLEYQHADKLLSPIQKECLVRLCLDLFRPGILLNQVLFLDSTHSILPAKVSNLFYTIQQHPKQQEPQPQQVQEDQDDETILLKDKMQTQSIGAVAASDTVIAMEYHHHLHKVMVCTPQWLQIFYGEPMQYLIHYPTSNNSNNNNCNGNETETEQEQSEKQDDEKYYEMIVCDPCHVEFDQQPQSVLAMLQTKNKL